MGIYLDVILISPYLLNFSHRENMSDDDDWQTNWKNFNRDFGNMSFWNRFNFPYVTRSFYELTENSPLAFEDILQIDKIWWDIKIDYQYMEEFKL